MYDTADRADAKQCQSFTSLLNSSVDLIIIHALSMKMHHAACTRGDRRRANDLASRIRFTSYNCQVR